MICVDCVRACVEPPHKAVVIYAGDTLCGQHFGSRFGRATQLQGPGPHTAGPQRSEMPSGEAKEVQS